MLAEREILLVEDNPADVRLTQEALKDAHVPEHSLIVVRDGLEAMAYLRQQGKYADVRTPDLVLLDLNLPGRSGHDVLREIKTCPALRHIPVIVLSTSACHEDITQAYALHANCYIVKPVDLGSFVEIMKHIWQFWFGIVQLPTPSWEGL